MALVRNFEANIVPMPSRIEITFGSFIKNTRIPNISDAVVKYYYQDYNMNTGNSLGASILEIKTSDLTPEDSDVVFDIFIKYFDNKYKIKHGIE
jgi:hypothetical protein